MKFDAAVYATIAALAVFPTAEAGGTRLLRPDKEEKIKKEKKIKEEKKIKKRDESLSPSTFPSLSPSMVPSSLPSREPSLLPTMSPSKSPSKAPSAFPSLSPTLLDPCKPGRPVTAFTDRATLKAAVDDFVTDSDNWRGSTDCDDDSKLTCGDIYGYVKR